MGSYLQVTKQTTLSQLADAVGERNVDYVLNANGLTRSVNIGKKLLDSMKDYLKSIGCEKIMIAVFGYNENAINFTKEGIPYGRKKEFDN